MNHRWDTDVEPVEGSRILAQALAACERSAVPYALIGGYSSIFWGRPRTTQGADLLIQIAAPGIRPFVRALEVEFIVSLEAAQDALRIQGEFNAIHKRGIFKVDFWPSSSAFDRQVLARRRQENITPDLVVWIQSPEDTILSKLRWCKLANFSERQYGDALGVYEIQEPTLDHGYLDRWAATLDVADLLARIRLEAARPPEQE